LRHGTARGGASRIRYDGRHVGPSRLRRLTLRASRIAPAFALAGALLAVPQVRGFAATAAMAAGGQPAAGAQAGRLAGGLPGAVAGLSDSLAGLQARAGAASRAGHPGRPAAPGRTGPRRPSGRPGVTGEPPRRAVRGLAARAQAGRAAGHPAAGAARRGRRGAARGAARPKLACSGSGGMLPENYATIVRFLMAHGYTPLAAAGIAGNIYQESKGNPESVGTGGGGLIGWTPLPGGFVTGNPAADLRTQLQAILVYNQQWAQYLPALNAAASPAQAADVYMTYFERPGIPAAANREGAAAAVAAACHL